MAQTLPASGSKARLAYTSEDKWGEVPSSPAMKILGAVTDFNVTPTMEELQSEAFTDSRTVENIRGGNIDVSGDVSFEAAVSGLAPFIYHAIGQPNTGMSIDPTTEDPMSGIQVLYAAKDATSGSGNLDFVASSNEVTWTSPNDTSSGAAVDVSQSGDYTVSSSTSDESITIRVNADNLPTSDTTSTVTVESTYRHRVTRSSLPPGMTMELGYTDIQQYFLMYGSRLDNLSLSVSSQGYATGSCSVMGRGYEDKGNQVLDSDPAEFEHKPLVHHDAEFLESGETAPVTDFSFDLSNNHSDSYYIGNKERGYLIEGQGSLSGSFTVAFQDNTYVDKWANETETSVKITFSDGTGRLRITIPRMRLSGDGFPGITTQQGIMQELGFSAMKSNDPDKTDIVVEFDNDNSDITQ